jgi:hypothetical protein
MLSTSFNHDCREVATSSGGAMNVQGFIWSFYVGSVFSYEVCFSDLRSMALFLLPKSAEFGLP